MAMSCLAINEAFSKHTKSCNVFTPKDRYIYDRYFWTIFS